jgi:type I restriction enzyme S subunit
MTTYSVIQKSQVESAQRLDAEYYQPEYLKTQDTLGKLKTVLLSDVCKITDGNHSKISEKFSNVGIRYLRGMDLSDFFISDADPVYIPDEVYKTLKRSYIFQNDVLVSIVGTVGLISIVADRYEKLTGNCKIAILHPRDIDQWFLATFLACRYGQAQIKRKVAGAVQTGIILKDLANIVIPVADGGKQKQVKEIIRTAHERHLLSKSFYSRAENLLLEHLGLKDFEPTEELSYIVNLSKVKSAHRADAEYFQPKYERIIEKLKKENVKLLGDLVSMQKGFEPGSEEYQSEGKLFMRVSNISKHGLIDKDQKYLSDELYQRLKKDFEPKAGEILLTKDATPGIGYVLKESVEGIIAGGVIRLKLKENIEGEYLALCINSIIGRMQIDRDAGGSVIVHWKPEQIKKLQVPILPKTTQQKIADLVRQSHQARKKTKELLEKAKKAVEEFIEKYQ